MSPDFPLTKSQIEDIVKIYPTPFHIYDEARIRGNSISLNQTMHKAGLADFCNYFAVKALPNPSIMKVLAEEGQGMDCSSLAELELATRIGLSGERIMFTSNNTTDEEYARAMELDAIINFDDISHIAPFLDKFGVPKVACNRFNPGNISFKDADESIIGKPHDAKYGMTKSQIIEAYRILQKAGVRKFGLHTMLLSNDLSWQNHARITELLLELAVEINQTLGIKFSFINLGGGIGVPYHPSEKPFDLGKFTQAIRKTYDKYELQKIGSPKIVMENGRFITADAGYLVTRAINHKNTHKKYIGVDASMSNLMRPGMYGAYHHITVLGKEASKTSEKVDITGSLCENNDKFAVDRRLPAIQKGNFLVIHTTGAHGHAMGFQYNGKLRSAELLLKPNGKVECIRRAETLDDYFATLIGENIPKIGKE